MARIEDPSGTQKILKKQANERMTEHVNKWVNEEVN